MQSDRRFKHQEYSDVLKVKVPSIEELDDPRYRLPSWNPFKEIRPGKIDIRVLPITNPLPLYYNRLPPPHPARHLHLSPLNDWQSHLLPATDDRGRTTYVAKYLAPRDFKYGKIVPDEQDVCWALTILGCLIAHDFGDKEFKECRILPSLSIRIDSDPALIERRFKKANTKSSSYDPETYDYESENLDLHEDTFGTIHLMGNIIERLTYLPFSKPIRLWAGHYVRRFYISTQISDPRWKCANFKCCYSKEFSFETVRCPKCHVAEWCSSECAVADSSHGNWCAYHYEGRVIIPHAEFSLEIEPCVQLSEPVTIDLTGPTVAEAWAHRNR